MPVEQAIKEAELSGRRLPEPGPWQGVGRGGEAAKEEARSSRRDSNDLGDVCSSSERLTARNSSEAS